MAVLLFQACVEGVLSMCAHMSFASLTKLVKSAAHTLWYGVLL